VKRRNGSLWYKACSHTILNVGLVGLAHQANSSEIVDAVCIGIN
jgi:hypothetical protein